MFWTNPEHFMEEINMEERPAFILSKSDPVLSIYLHSTGVVSTGNNFCFWTAVSQRDLTAEKTSDGALSGVFYQLSSTTPTRALS